MQQVLTCLPLYPSPIEMVLLHLSYGEVAMLTPITRFMRYKNRLSHQTSLAARVRGLSVVFCLLFSVGGFATGSEHTEFSAQTVNSVKSVSKSRRPVSKGRSLKRALNENGNLSDLERKHRSDIEIQALKLELRAALRVYDRAGER